MATDSGLDVKMKIEDYITKNEGFELKPYRCTSGKLTIGVGRNLEDVGISIDEAYYLLGSDIKRIKKEIQKNSRLESVYTKLDDNRQNVMVDLIMNLGLSRFLRFNRFISALDKRDFVKASEELLFSNPSIVPLQIRKEMLSGMGIIGTKYATPYLRQVKGRAVRNAYIIRHGNHDFPKTWWSRGWV